MSVAIKVADLELTAAPGRPPVGLGGIRGAQILAMLGHRH